MSGMIAVDVKGLLPLKKQLTLLALPRLQRKKLLKYVAYRLIRDTRRRVKKRIDINGRSFSERPDGWKDKHAIDRVAKFLSVKSVDGLTAEIGWRQERTARLANKIHRGSRERVNDYKRTEAHEFDLENAPATRWQARALVANGYRRPSKNGHPGKLATVRWLRGKPTDDGKYRKNFNMTAKQAATILGYMRRNSFKKDRYNKGLNKDDKIDISGRPFLGATKQEVNQYLIEIMNKYTKEITHGAR